MTIEICLAYVLACILIAIIPGPTVTVIVANSLAHGARAGLLNVAGTQLGLGLMMAILIVGLSSPAPSISCTSAGSSSGRPTPSRARRKRGRRAAASSCRGSS